MKKILGKYSRNGHSHYEKSVLAVSANQIRRPDREICEKCEPLAAVFKQTLKNSSNRHSQ
jgi:hypothetical protein